MQGIEIALPTSEQPYGRTVRSYLQKFLQGIGELELYTFTGKHTYKNVDLIAGDFWLNVYGESLSVGSDLLTGTGITKYAVISDMVKFANKQKMRNTTMLLLIYLLRLEHWCGLHCIHRIIF